MLGLKLSYLIPILGLAIAFFYSEYSQNILMATQTAPTSGKPWADGPLKLITTPMYELKKDDTFTKGASHMALLHNAMLRGYNSIYLQAPHVKPADYADFIGYCLTWHKFVKHHHDDEEANLFPKVLEVLGKEDKEVWAKTHEEHEAMLPPLTALHTYLSTLPSPSALSIPTLLSHLDAASTPLSTHLHSEIATLTSLSSLCPPDSPTATAAAPLFKAWGKHTVSSAGYLDVVPFLFLNFDRTVEGGLWAEWPPMPALVRWALVRVGGAWHAAWWRFASCDGEGRPRELFALGE